MPDAIIRNCGKTSFDKTLLFSHLTAPLSDFGVHHANHLECLYSIDVFHDLGFNVDVCDYRFPGKIDYLPYSVVYGFGHPWANAFNQNAHRPLAVYYAMIAHPFHVFSQTTSALRRFYERNGLWLKESGRYIQETAFVAEPFYADAVVLLGNGHSKGVYQRYCQAPVYLLNAPYNEVLESEALAGKDFSKARKHFLWIGSNNLIHKGLDVTLEAFAERPEAVLHVCALPKEKRFFDFYRKILDLPNIFFHGFLDLRSKRFRHLMRECAFTVCPSWAEGQVTSVVNAMANGLLPLVSPDCGIEREDYVHELAANDIPSIRDAVDRCLAMDPRDIQALSTRCLEGTRKLHGKDAYCASLKAALLSIMQEKQNVVA